MTQNNKDMPDEIYVFPDPQSIGDRGFTTTEPDMTCDGKAYTKYVRADLASAPKAVEDAPFDFRSASGVLKPYLEQTPTPPNVDLDALREDIDRLVGKAGNTPSATRLGENIKAALRNTTKE